MNSTVEQLRDAVTAAEDALMAWDQAHQVGPTDPGMQSMRFHTTQAKLDKNLSAYLNRLGRESKARARLEEDLRKAKRALHLASQPTTPVDPATLKGATAVQVLERGTAVWHRVVRVNRTTVTCWAAPGFDQPRYPYSRIVGVHHRETREREGELT